ncbi:MAG: class I SAM-dependent methyltransferase [Firmicutes bacterium]|nr:class I SAM-dependent methyltransferase [Bacillota bacterium]
MEKNLRKNNQKAWEQNTYKAWLNRFGTPEKAAKKIIKDPIKRLSTLYKYFDELEGKKVINLLGSNGNKAVALALLGADVTIADFSYGNYKYAKDLADASNVDINYLVKDVLDLPKEELTGKYDYVFAELGILHYFQDLKPLMETIYKLLKKDGRLILQDFHPFSTKLISSRGKRHKTRKHKIKGDYFDTSLEERDVAFLKFLKEEDRKNFSKVKLRKWTLGEVITAIASEGLFIKVLEELPNMSSNVFDPGIPKSFTVVAEKI